MLVNRWIRKIGKKVLGKSLSSILYAKMTSLKFQPTYKKIKTNQSAMERWLQKERPKVRLWGINLVADDFVQKLNKHHTFGKDKDILEIGPGLGRVLYTINSLGLKYRHYVGVDTVEPNIVYLSEAFNKDNCQFVVGDIEKIHLDKKFDIVFSSLMFKHFMPTFENALKNIEIYMKSNSMIFFDLDEVTSTEQDELGGTYTGQYTENQIRQILQNCNLTLVKFETVKHTNDRIGLLVIAKKLIVHSTDCLCFQIT